MVLPIYTEEQIEDEVRHLTRRASRSFERFWGTVSCGMFLVCPLLILVTLKFALGWSWLASLWWGFCLWVTVSVVLVFISARNENRLIREAVEEFYRHFPVDHPQWEDAVRVFGEIESACKVEKRIMNAVVSAAELEGWDVSRRGRAAKRSLGNLEQQSDGGRGGGAKGAVSRRNRRSKRAETPECRGFETPRGGQEDLEPTGHDHDPSGEPVRSKWRI